MRGGLREQAREKLLTAKVVYVDVEAILEGCRVGRQGSALSELGSPRPSYRARPTRSTATPREAGARQIPSSHASTGLSKEERKL